MQIVNAGMVGFSSFQVLQYLKTTGLTRFQPRVVVFCVGINDSCPVALSDREQFERNCRPVARFWRLLQRSNLFLFLERYTRELLAWVTTGRNPSGLDFLYYDDGEKPQVLRNTPEETEENFRAAGRLVEEHDALPILILEDARSVYPRAWSAVSYRQGRERMQLWAQNREWPIIDIAVLMETPWSLDRSEYLLDFCHPNPRGNQVIGELLADVLIQRIPSQQERTSCDESPVGHPKEE